MPEQEADLTIDHKSKQRAINANEETLSFHDFLEDRKTSTLKKYQMIVLGEPHTGHLIAYELLTFFLTYMPGMPGLFLRQKAYRWLFKHLGRKTTIGVGVAVRQPKKIAIGRHCVIDDNVFLSARGSDQSGICIADKTYLGRNTELKAREGLIEIGESCSIGSQCRMAIHEGKITIGRDVFVAAFCNIGGGNHRFDRTDIPIMQQGFESKGGVTIGDDVWIGSNTVIADGVTIGKGAIIGSCSYVNKDIPAYAIAFGSPAQVRKSRLNTSAKYR